MCFLRLSSAWQRPVRGCDAALTGPALRRASGPTAGLVVPCMCMNCDCDCNGNAAAAAAVQLQLPQQHKLPMRLRRTMSLSCRRLDRRQDHRRGLGGGCRGSRGRGRGGGRGADAAAASAATPPPTKAARIPRLKKNRYLCILAVFKKSAFCELFFEIWDVF